MINTTGITDETGTGTLYQGSVADWNGGFSGAFTVNGTTLSAAP